jgi:hypothetical protein
MVYVPPGIGSRTRLPLLIVAMSALPAKIDRPAASQS